MEGPARTANGVIWSESSALDFTDVGIRAKIMHGMVSEALTGHRDCCFGEYFSCREPIMWWLGYRVTVRHDVSAGSC